MFDSEMILKPPGNDDTSIFQRTKDYWSDGLAEEYFMFEEGGTFYTAIRTEAGAIVLLDSEAGYRVTEVFNTVSEWYVRVIRPDFADMYGLPCL